MSEVLVDIPNYANWETRSLGQICSEVRRGSAPVYVDTSSVKAIGQRCITHTDFEPSAARSHSEKAMSGVLIARNGDVLLNSTGTGTIGRSCVYAADGTFIIDGHVTLLRPVTGQVDSRWLNALIRSSWFQTHMERFCYTGSTNQLELSRVQLSSSSVPVPSLFEQAAMGDVLDTLDTQIRQTEAIIAKLQQVKQGLLHDLLSRGIDANGQLRPPREEAPELYKESPLGWIPKEWNVENLSDCTLKIADRDHTTPNYVESGVIIISPVNFFGDEGIDFDGAKKISRAAHENNLKKTDLKAGDVLLHRIGAGLGRVRLVTSEMPEFSILHSMAQLRPDPKEMNSSYLLWVMRSESTKNQMGLSTQSIGVPDLGLEKIGQFLVPQPYINEQCLIANQMNVLQEKTNDHKCELLKLKKQKAGLMDDLLTGRVRVTGLIEQQRAS